MFPPCRQPNYWALFVCGFCLVAGSLSAQIIQNGSFENNYTNWTASGHQVIATNDAAHPASDGTHVVVFNNADQFANASLSQTFNTTPGQRYRLAIDVSTVAEEADQRLEIRLTGNNVIYDNIVTFAGIDANALYTPQFVTFVANSSTTTLLLQDASITYTVVDMLIDNISVTPEPANAPIITQGPVRFATAVGRGATFSVTASDPTNAGLNYQWRFEGSPIGGANSSSFTIPSVASNNAGNYDVVVSNSAGIVASSSVTLTVLPPGILLNGSFEHGSAAWFFSGTNCSISTNFNYGVTDGVQLTHFNQGQTPPGGFISQSFQTINGQTYVLQWDYGAFSAPNVTSQQRMRATVVSGGGGGTLLDQTVSVNAPGNGSRYLPASFTFVGDGSNVTLTFKDVSLTTDSVDLLLDNVRVSLQNAPTIATQPQSQAVETGGTATFTVVANGQAPLHYQWYFNNNPIPGANSDSYTINSAQSGDGGDYYVVVSNSVDTVTSATAVLTVLPPDLLVNGSFEFNYTGWTETGNQAVVAGGSTDGTHLVLFNASNLPPNGILSQTINTTSGQRYILTFDVGANAYQSTEEMKLKVTATGNTTLLNQTASQFAQGTGLWYTSKSFSFVADSGSTVITFQDQSTGTLNVDCLLDNVRVVEASPSILTNGGFENDFTAWAGSGNEQIVTTAMGYPVTEGSKCVLFNGAQSPPNGSLSQTFATTAGQGYVLAFDQGATGFQTTAQQILLVTLQGTNTLVSQNSIVTGQGSGTWWTGKTLNFVADSSSTTVTFQDVSPTTDSIDLLLDNVRLNSTGASGPVITQQPQSVTTTAGSQVSFTVAAAGQGTLTYQWYFGTTPIGGATNNVFTINSVQNADQGNYSVTVTDNNSTVTSATAVLQVVAAGALMNGSFENDYTGWTATGHQGIGGSPYPATDGSKLVVLNSQNATPNAVLSQQFATNAGQGYTLTFDQGVTAFQSSLQQRLQVTVQGNTTRLSQPVSVFAQGTGTWFTAQTLSFVADSSTTTLSFTDTSPGTKDTDMLLDNVRVVPQSGPVISSQPQSTTVQVGDPVTFNVTASGVGTLHYQWRKGGNPIGGAPDADTYSIPSAQNTDAGDYDVVVTDDNANVTSGAAELTVIPAGIIANGSFEYGLFGWTNSGIVTSTNGYPTTDGSFLAVFNYANQTPNGVISQAFDTVVGHHYQLQFDLGVLSYASTAEQKMQVDVVGGSSLFSQTYSIFGQGAGNGFAFQPKTINFTANSSTTTLTFTDRSVTTISIDVMVDNVRVVDLGP